MGNALLEEHSPEGIGSYAAIVNGCDEKLGEMMKNFLEGIGYVGFANFDMKYDHRDGKYKLFEMNLRQGRSSYFVTAAGYNLTMAGGRRDLLQGYACCVAKARCCGPSSPPRSSSTT